MAWWERAYVGQKVECIRDDWSDIDQSFPVFGEQCTITDIYASERYGFDDCSIYFRLNGKKHWHNAKCFRPLEETREHSGMKTIREILDRANKRVEEVA